MESLNNDEQTQNIINSDEDLSEVNSSDEIKNKQNTQNIERTMGDDNDAMQVTNSLERVQPITSHTNRKVGKRKYEKVRVIKQRASKDKAKRMIRYLSKSQIKKSMGSFKRKAVRSEATLKRSFNRRRSSNSVTSSLCPICNHSCCKRLSK